MAFFCQSGLARSGSGLLFGEDKRRQTRSGYFSCGAVARRQAGWAVQSELSRRYSARGVLGAFFGAAMRRASTCVVCALLLSLPAAWSLLPSVGRLGPCSSRTASRATDPFLQIGDHDESDAKTVERIAGTYYVTGRITAQDQEVWLSINKLNAQREATATKVVAAFFIVMVVVIGW